MHSDQVLQTSVLEALAWEPSVPANNIGVTVGRGVVTLSGHVESFAQKHAAEVAARSVKGVKAVVEEIRVELSAGQIRGDAQIALAAANSLEWDVSVPADRVSIMIDRGWITLTGEVDWHFQKVAAEQDVRRLAGVVAVDNQITIKPLVNTAELSDKITHALHRSWFFDPTIKVSAEGGAVRLTGTVHSSHERRAAASTAWSAPGTTSVENDITIA
jgi:osmotically-inducible protein OsmY